MNEQIEKPYHLALDILKPTKKELDHGLKLHAESIVFDAYGFAPRYAVDGGAIMTVMEQGASSAETVNMFEDMIMTGFVNNPEQSEEIAQAWQASGVTCIFQNAGQEGQSVKNMIKRMAHFTFLTDMMHHLIQKAAKPDDIIQVKKQGNHCLYFTCNGVPLEENWNSVEEELCYIKIFFQLGCRMMHLTYNRRNMLGDGCAEPSNAGLSDFGRAAIAEMNRIGVIVDVAHSGHRTSLEAAQASKYPTVASHSGCSTINDHCRNKPDEVIRAIADTDGYVGICCIPAFLGRNGDINALLDHVDYIARKFGTDYVAIGTDTAYHCADTEAEEKKISWPKTRQPFRSFWPSNDTLADPKWAKLSKLMSLTWTNWPLFTVGLVQRGYSDSDIQKIIGGNVLRVAGAALDTRQNRV